MGEFHLENHCYPMKNINELTNNMLDKLTVRSSGAFFGGGKFIYLLTVNLDGSELLIANSSL